MRSPRAKSNIVAVSAYTKETAINTEQDPDLSLNVALGDMIGLDRRIEDDSEEMNGYEEPTRTYNLGKTASCSFNFDKMQPHHAAFLLAYGLGTISSAAAGTGYAHTITPIAGDESLDQSLPSFTAAMRFGTNLAKRRYASMFIDQVTLTFARDSWVKAVANIKGTGKVTTNVTEETLTAKDDATSITLAANGVEGSTAQERLDSVHRIRVELTSGVWTEVAFSAVSDATPAVITITAPGALNADVSYKITYVPTESASWMTFPSRVVETPLRVSEATLVIGGTWNGTAFSGGKTMQQEVKSVEWSLQNNLEIAFPFGAGGAYASEAFRPNRKQSLKFDRYMRDWIMQTMLENDETFGIKILAEGAVYDSPHKYTVQLIFPKVGMLNLKESVDGKRNAESVEFVPLEDGTYPTVTATVKNLVAAFAA